MDEPRITGRLLVQLSPLILHMQAHTIHEVEVEIMNHFADMSGSFSSESLSIQCFYKV